MTEGGQLDQAVRRAETNVGHVRPPKKAAKRVSRGTQKRRATKGGGDSTIKTGAAKERGRSRTKKSSRSSKHAPPQAAGLEEDEVWGGSDAADILAGISDDSEDSEDGEAEYPPRECQNQAGKAGTAPYASQSGGLGPSCARPPEYHLGDVDGGVSSEHREDAPREHRPVQKGADKGGKLPRARADGGQRPKRGAQKKHQHRAAAVASEPHAPLVYVSRQRAVDRGHVWVRARLRRRIDNIVQNILGHPPFQVTQDFLAVCEQLQATVAFRVVMSAVLLMLNRGRQTVTRADIRLVRQIMKLKPDMLKGMGSV